MNMGHQALQKFLVGSQVLVKSQGLTFTSQVFDQQNFSKIKQGALLWCKCSQASLLDGNPRKQRTMSGWPAIIHARVRQLIMSKH